MWMWWWVVGVLDHLLTLIPITYISFQFSRQRRASLQLDRQTLSTIRPAEVRTNDMNDPSSSSPSSCHRRRFSIHHESASMGTWFGPGLAEHSSTRDTGSRQRRGSLDGSIPSGLTFGSPPVRKQSLTHGFGLQKSMDTASQVGAIYLLEVAGSIPCLGLLFENILFSPQMCVSDLSRKKKIRRRKRVSLRIVSAVL